MWVRKSSIRPVPSFARIPKYELDRVREELLVSGDDAHDRLDDVFEEFEEQQPAVASHVGRTLGRSLGEPTMALGFFLSLAVWLAFERRYGVTLQTVSDAELRSTSELFSFDESLREREPTEAVETNDVIAMEQPALVGFIHEHMEATLNLRESQVDPDELQAIYRMVLIEVLALSYAVRPPTGFPVSKAEVMA